ncbi:MAG: geranylgeranyl reductase family protein [Acidimicrobiales bacterium]
MGRRDYDAVVVGAGPGGSMAALELASGGARVALVDKARFPRDKACGDLVGPRGVALLTERGVVPDSCLSLGDMEVIGPGGGRVLLPARAGRSYPGVAWALPRRELDDMLRQAAVAAGAEPVRARVTGVRTDGDVVTVGMDGAPDQRTGAVIGADGAGSTVAASAGMVGPDRVQLGFAVRTYLRVRVPLPVIVLLEDSPGVGFPGYGWLFPGPGGMANAGVGVGVGADRRAGATATRRLDAFVRRLEELDLVPTGTGSADRLGGWLKMGMVGTTAARGPVLLVGDAAGLVNPLQGEGISQAMESGVAAARAVMGATGQGPRVASDSYRSWLAHHQAGFQGSAAALQSALLDHPRLISRTARTLTWPPVGRRLAAGWALYWNDLVAGATPGPGTLTARLAQSAARAVTAPAASRRRLRRDLMTGPPDARRGPGGRPGATTPRPSAASPPAGPP